MNILILGAGAVGLSVAARISGIASVHAVCRPQQAQAIGKEGFFLTGLWGDETHSFSCSDDAPDRDWDYIIITSKSTDTRSVCNQFSDILRNREVMSLQNGIGNEEIIREYTDRVIGAMIITSFEWKGTSSVHVSVEGGPMKMGRFPEGIDAHVIDLYETIKAARISVETSSNIMSDIWGKTLYNCALNPTGAILEVPYGDLVHPRSWEIISSIVAEAFSVAVAEGIKLAWETREEYLQHLRDVLIPATARHHSSMLQDIIRGKRTEIDSLNGAIVARGSAQTIPTPYNACVSDMIRCKEQISRGGL